MKVIEIADDVYEFLRHQQTGFAETASDVLRRLLKANSVAPSGPQVESWGAVLPPDSLTRVLQEELARNPRKKALWEFLKGSEFKAERNAVGKFLALLSFLHRENHDKFASAQGISGRSRKYFAKSESDLEQSGNSVHPKRIPGSEYWVVTNNSTQSKVELLHEVLKVLGYDGECTWFVTRNMS